MTDEYIPREAALKAIYTSTAPALEIEAIPAADVVEVRHGQWEYDDFDGDGLDYQCTMCKRYSRRDYNYCPNCGARMDGGQDDG